MSRQLVAAIVLFACAALAYGQGDPPAVTLKVGDPAPKLEVSKWVKGGPIASLEQGKIYVIECWATWCGPCRKSIPHVTALQAKYKDQGVVVIGLNVWERDLTLVEPFVQKMGDTMGYAVATDVVEAGSTTGKMATTWLAAAGRNGIPCSFLVDKQGKLAWIGHPMMMDRPLAQLAADKFDAAEQAAFDQKVNDLEKDLRAAMQAQDFDKALGVLDQVLALDPATAPMREPMRLSILLRKGDYPAANALAKKLTTPAEAQNDASALGSVAYMLLGAADQTKIDADLALKLALRLSEVAEKEDLMAKMILAKAYAAKGQFDKAVTVQTELVAKAQGPMKQAAEKDLAAYQARIEKK
jgi:thiol-disulfide isomerase/thioredoxin